MFLRRDRAMRLYASLHPWCRAEALFVGWDMQRILAQRFLHSSVVPFEVLRGVLAVLRVVFVCDFFFGFLCHVIFLEYQWLLVIGTCSCAKLFYF